MTHVAVHYRRRRLRDVEVSDWTAKARCPECRRTRAVYRVEPERDGFYMVTLERLQDAPHHVAIVQTYRLAHYCAVEAARRAADRCGSCWTKLVREARSSAAPGSTGAARAKRAPLGLSIYKQVTRDCTPIQSSEGSPA
ncbi:hypothetical protein [Algiphilus sp.]|uniref:hypothetical protein n=1 Tax=Algiphilus sp. TaxID=1872431 RepID=UPI0025C4A39E|nr:hypothetical protein [Algiphilus sp.]MCK5770832.1 hypothetical protein [Algiphilus sp.]